MYTVYMYGVNIYVRCKLVKEKVGEDMTYDGGVTTETRAPLTRDRIVEAAVAYADEHGVESLSMRKLGAELGVEAMALYNHVDNKDDIYDGMIDFVFSSVELPPHDLGWRDSLRFIGDSGMAQFSAHGWVVTLLMTRGNFGPGALRFMDHVLGILADAGFSREDAHHAWQMLASHTMGYAFQQATGPSAKSDRDENELESQLASLADVFPNVAALAPELARCDFGSEYSFGLEIIIDGLGARLPSVPGST
jgi:AcrR family transcriptional regulator